ncbi:hypothetical protein CR513_26843, partial [Mucuna pruriens]
MESTKLVELLVIQVMASIGNAFHKFSSPHSFPDDALNWEVVYELSHIKGDGPPSDDLKFEAWDKRTFSS